MKKAYALWEELKTNPTSITKFQVIEPDLREKDASNNEESFQADELPEKVKIKNIKFLNPNISSKERQQKMSFWLIPFGFLAGITFSKMTGLQTFSDLGFSQINETLAGGLLGMAAGWIGSFFAARSVNQSQEDLKELLKFHEKGFWLVLLETPFESEPPWLLIKRANPIEIVNLDLI